MSRQSAAMRAPASDEDALPVPAMTDTERLDEIAQLLALGIVRRRMRRNEGDIAERNRPAVFGVDFGVDFGAGQSVCGSEPETDGEET